MPNIAHQNDVLIDRVHSSAVREEIGDTLSATLGPQFHELPPRLLALMKQLVGDEHTRTAAAITGYV
jgi:hypothetical protein